MILVIDTETNGLPIDWKAPKEEVENWPRIIQIAWQHYTPEGKKIAEHNYLIKPNGFELKKEAQAVNGITLAMLEKDGVSIKYALKMLELSLHVTTKIVAHNMSFDKKVVQAEMVRTNQIKALEKMHDIEKICTMMSTTKFCNLPGPRGAKWPKLEELHMCLFKSIPTQAHDALADVDATAKCFFELHKRGIIGA